MQSGKDSQGQLCARQVGVAAALNGECVGGGDQGVVKGGFAAVCVAVALAGVELEADAGLFAQAYGYTSAHAVGFAAALDGGGVDGGQQVDVLCGVQGDVVGL